MHEFKPIYRIELLQDFYRVLSVVKLIQNITFMCLGWITTKTRIEKEEVT